MTIVITPEVILHNAFTSRQKLQDKIDKNIKINEISFIDYSIFCSNLGNAISKLYKYYIMDCGQSHLDEYCKYDEDNRFMTAIHEIHLLKQYDNKITDKLNNMYPKDIKEILDNCERFWDIKQN